MENIRSLHLKRLHARLGDIAYELTKVQFSHFAPPRTWQPAINAYRCEDCLAICVDLAGVDRNLLDVQVEPRRLVIRGQRLAPEPERTERKPVQVLIMEVDYGPFEREILLPSEVDRERVTAEHRDGLVWIYLPLRPHA